MPKLTELSTDVTCLRPRYPNLHDKYPVATEYDKMQPHIAMHNQLKERTNFAMDALTLHPFAETRLPYRIPTLRTSYTEVLVG